MLRNSVLSKFTLSQLVADYLLPSKYSVVFQPDVNLARYLYDHTRLLCWSKMIETRAKFICKTWVKRWHKWLCFLSYYPFRHGEGSRTLNSEDNTNIWLHLLAPHQRRWLVPEGRQRYLRHSGESPTFAQWAFITRTDKLRISLQGVSQTVLL